MLQEQSTVVLLTVCKPIVSLIW